MWTTRIWKLHTYGLIIVHVSSKVHLGIKGNYTRPARRCRPVLTYRVSSGYDSTVFAPAPLASVRPSNFGACKKQHHVHVATRPRPWSTWWLTVSCSSRPGTSLLFAVRTPKRDPGSANCPLNFELWFLIISLLFDKRLYIYIPHDVEYSTTVHLLLYTSLWVSNRCIFVP